MVNIQLLVMNFRPRISRIEIHGLQQSYDLDLQKEIFYGKRNIKT